MKNSAINNNPSKRNRQSLPEYHFVSQNKLHFTTALWITSTIISLIQLTRLMTLQGCCLDDDWKCVKSFLHDSEVSLAVSLLTLHFANCSVNCNLVFSTISSKTSRQHPTERFQWPFNDFLSCAIIFICAIFLSHSIKNHQKEFIQDFFYYFPDYFS